MWVVVEAVQVQLKKGVLELCVLALLSGGDAYGYEIASRLADGIEMGEGTVYPLMRRLQAEKLVETYLVESSSGPSRKYYRLTSAGRERLEAQRSEWAAFSAAVDAILEGSR
jgi:PadR family transcriptional regulator PadR